MNNIKLYNDGNAMQYSDIFYAGSYLGLVTGHISLMEHHDITLYMSTKDYDTDMQAWNKWLQKNKNKYSLAQTDSIYQTRIDSISMIAWNKWLLSKNANKYSREDKDTINLLFYSGVALPERPKVRRNNYKYHFSFLSDTTFKDFYQKMNGLMRNVKKYYYGKPVDYTDAYYAVNYLALITGIPSRIHFGKVTFYETDDDFKNDMDSWSKWLRNNKTKYTIEEADNIFKRLWENLEEHPYMWFYDELSLDYCQTGYYQLYKRWLQKF
ncbi:MAG: hypothetical protein LBL33_01155 [Tannerella sp.]|jgi:hypothetical protein|nr:hypothetical protein [Tannerella sp.]